MKKSLLSSVFWVGVVAIFAILFATRVYAANTITGIGTYTFTGNLNGASTINSLGQVQNSAYTENLTQNNFRNVRGKLLLPQISYVISGRMTTQETDFILTGVYGPSNTVIAGGITQTLHADGTTVFTLTPNQ